nr:EF-hand domain-containing protein [uncultured Rhodoferax sp.]
MNITLPQHRSLRTTLALTGVALLLGACAAPQSPSTAAAPAQPAGGHGQSAFLGSYDGNRDGVVPRAEYDAIRKQRFEAGDTNRDGVLNEAEYVAEFEQRLKQQYFSEGRQPDKAYEGSIKQAHVRFAILDRDRDNKLSREEDLAVADKTFKSADTNGDGVVSRNDPPAEPRASGGNAAP